LSKVEIITSEVRWGDWLWRFYVS